MEMCRRIVVFESPVVFAAVAMVCDGNSESVGLIVLVKVVPLCWCAYF